MAEKKSESPDALAPASTTAEIEAHTPAALKAKRAEAIRKYRDRGHVVGGENRAIRSDQHAEFLARAGTITLP